MKNIIVATDFSIKSYNALTIAKKIAKKTQGTIHLFHVIQPVLAHYSIMGESINDEYSDIYTLKLTNMVKEKLSVLQTAHSDESYTLETKFSIGNDAFKELNHFADHIKADLVIIGDKGFSDSEEFFLGSLTDKVIRSLSCPVLTVKEAISDEDFDNIVYATNLKEDHKKMMQLLITFQKLFNSTIHLVKINTTQAFENEIDTKVALQKLVDQYELTNCTMNVYSHEDEEYGIVYFADEKRADMIAMGVHEKSGFRRLISGGSISSEVVDHTFRPVLTCQFQTN